jgi:glycosyltransferase involved in cell wall biosynthesis
MKKIKISAALATYNEETNIVDCLQSLAKVADEIVVVDGSSSDNTVELAKKMGARVITTSNKPMFHINKNLAISKCTGNWILLMDADEIISNDLAAEIKNVVNASPSENGFWINRSNWFLGGFLKKGGAYPDSVIRLFRKGKGHLPEVTVHEQVKIQGTIGALKGDILHLADPTFERYLNRALRYTDETALKIEKKGPGPMGALRYMVVKPVLTFVNIFFRHKGYQDGFRGFIWALFSASHAYYAYTKYLEKTPKVKN